MPIYRIPEQHLFPNPELANSGGLLGVGGDLHPDRILLAYRQGIFPWYSEGQPILWWSPDPRMVLWVDALHISRSLGKIIRRGDFHITMDTAFDEVMTACADVPRPGQQGTWITPELKEGFVALHDAGHAHSIEAWKDGELVGGLYGLTVGRVFCGESMFAVVPNASKVAFVALVQQLRRWGFPMVDCQVHTPHLARFGAREVPRKRFLADLTVLGSRPGRVGPWTLDPDLAGPEKTDEAPAGKG